MTRISDAVRYALCRFLPSALVLAGGAVVSAASGPGFRCAGATGFAERRICADAQLSARDRALTALYARALTAAPDRAGLRAAQRAALRRRGACVDRSCLVAWYDERTAVLAQWAALRLHPGACIAETVRDTGPRLEGMADSGSSIRYTDGMAQVSYEVLPGIRASRTGDPVRLCLRSRPAHCPPGDVRGAVYAARNLRTGGEWTAGDSEHQCGGA